MATGLEGFFTGGAISVLASSGNSRFADAASSEAEAGDSVGFSAAAVAAVAAGGAAAVTTRFVPGSVSGGGGGGTIPCLGRTSF